MKAYFSKGRLDEAVLIIDRMRASGVQPTFDTWTTVINAIDAHGKVNTADDLYADALSSGTINPYRPWRSNVIRLASGKVPMTGRIMDLHELNQATGQAAIRHELKQRQECTIRRQAPLYIITGQGDGSLQRAVCKVLRSQGKRALRPKGENGVVFVPPEQ
eukprot:TRINITY_DN5238_c0_g1_i1.p1 TRINITY_DN5238_c0_g1~~TRINITY_DN5238_c0_g1_i1.p1  ORF type:complete len:161 (+),score=14.65 TRINITY_DN5238_c0_g1_i1:97-579(+)